MRTIALVILVALAPTALAQAQDAATPTLSLDSTALTLPPGGNATVALLFANPTDAPVTFALNAQSDTGVSAKLGRESVTVPANGRERVQAMVLAPQKADTSHVVRFLAKETTAAARATALQLQAELTLTVGPASPVAITIEPREVSLPQGGETTVRVVIANAGPAIDAPELVPKAAQGIEIVIEDAPASLPAGARSTFTLRLRHVGDEPVGTARESGIGLVSPRSAGTFRIVIAEPVPPSPDASVGQAQAPVVIAAAAATSVALAAWLTRHKWLGLFAALYTRLAPSRVLDHPLRREIADLVQREQGITFGELARRLDIGAGQLTHHARMLEKAGVVFSSPDGQQRRFFHVGQGRLQPIAPLPERALAALAGGPRRASELARELGVSRQALHYHIRRLEGEGRIVTRPDGRELWLEAQSARSSAA